MTFVPGLDSVLRAAIDRGAVMDFDCCGPPIETPKLYGPDMNTKLTTETKDASTSALSATVRQRRIKSHSSSGGTLRLPATVWQQKYSDPEPSRPAVGVSVNQLRTVSF
mmetsp:Transcript_49573/g.97640  ORF Transcript_49573/g.97640 Transcript_49573/m.97640 type:complete len:109 (-) Transcript_49573:72-398(-)